MYKIDEATDKEKYILLVPSMLDAHFPLLKYAFYSKNYRPVILENEENITDTGLHYVNNDMCYPAILNVGQMVNALKSGKYDLKRTRLLMPTAGDACRGSSYSWALRRAVENAGFSEVKVLTLNVKGIEKDAQMKLEPGMVLRALFGLFYGDILMLLVNQVRPYEREPGAADACRQRWIERLSEDLKTGKHLTLHHMKKNFELIAKDFSEVEKTGEVKQRVGIVGELYIKYCHIGNWNVIKKLEAEGCESHTNGLSWYVMYYIDSHLSESGLFMKLLYTIAKSFIGHLQKNMIAVMKKYGFYTLEKFNVLKKEAAGYVSFNSRVGDGWLIGAEAVGHCLHDCPKVIAMQPFGCMPNQICGRGLYPSINRKLPQGQIVSVDMDSSGSELNVYNRIKMLVDS
ncbi:MAG: 2-hydroxyacyl-CoA dehydratase [Lachnospiraceae bacterium]|nr:2-hydroxyacyl-CoA dehydratase [Lachnospiraceae bacterium]